MLKKLAYSLRKRKGLVIIITAALLIEAISAIQYFRTHEILEEEMEKRAESELTMKAILIKSTLNSNEDILMNHIWDIYRNLSHPDSLFDAVSRVVRMNRYVSGSFIAFAPDYYPSRGRLFEPYAQKEDGDVKVWQIGGQDHDYTQYTFYQDALNTEGPFWVDPYYDNVGLKSYITSYVIALRDKSQQFVGVAGIDLSVKWMSDTIEHKHIYPSSFNLLLTEDGKVITRPDEKRVSKASSDYFVRLINDSTVARKKSRSGRSDMIPFEKDGEKGTIFYAFMKNKPHWQIAVVCHDKEVYAVLNSLRIHMLLLMLLGFGALLFIVWLFARNEEKLKEKTINEQKMENELHIAHTIQQTLLPEKDEKLDSTAKDVKVEGRLIPAKAVGGDLYNDFVRDDKLFFCIGDVSGKGVPSALIMAIMQSVFRTIASRENNPAHIMTQLNEMGCRNNKENIFVTLFVGVLDLPTGRLRFCNAGHEKPILIKRQSNGDSPEEVSTTCQMLDVKPNLPVALFSDFKYEEQEIMMEKGSTLFLYTDGLTEGRNAKNEQFGKERTMEVLANSNATDPKQLVDGIVDQMNQFSAGTEQSDDLTLLAVSYTPVEEHEILDEELVLQNNVQQVEQLNTFVKQSLQRLGVERPLSNKLRLAVEEAVVNVMQYAYPTGTTGDISIRLTSNGQRIKFVITDSGGAFNPTEVSAADTTLSAEDRPIGGLGILLVRKLMDSINYERSQGKNVLTLRKEYKNIQ